MRYLRAPTRRPKPDFSLSTINIIFLLLLFYLATGSLIQPGELDAEVPVTQDLPLEKLPRPLLLMTADGLLLDGQPVTRAQAAGAVQAAIDQLPAKSRFLNLLAEQRVPAARLLDLAAELQTADVPIRLVTLRRGFQAVQGSVP